LTTWRPPYICQPKLDGERCRAILLNGKALLLSSEENIILSVPLIQKELEAFSLAVKVPLELDGELYCHGMSFEDVHSIVGRTVNLNPDHFFMEFHVFDLVQEQNEQCHRLLELKKLSQFFTERIQLVPSKVSFTLEEVRESFDLFIKNGYEGIVIREFNATYLRRRSTWVMKFKPRKKDIYTISGYVEGTGKYSNTLGALLCKTDGIEFEIGSFSLTDERRQELWEKRYELTNYDAVVAYQHRWSSGKPKSGVFIDLVERLPEVKFNNPLD
jgi:ATP-dependent DNA ligase